MTYTLIERVREVLESERIPKHTYEFEEFNDEDNVEMLHANLGILYSDLTDKLRDRNIYVNATAELREDDYGATFFLIEKRDEE